MDCPSPTPIYRFMHIDNLRVCLRRGALHASNHVPDDGHAYRTIHNVSIQRERHIRAVPCGPGGVIHDYVPFYFGPRSPMLFQLHTGWVEGYNEGQEPLVYLVSTAQAIHESSAGYVFSDGHGIASFTMWFDDLADLDKVDWEAVHARVWRDTVNDTDRQRRKQAEFLVHRRCDMSLIQNLGVLNAAMRTRVEEILAEFPEHRFGVDVRPEWYY